jgi:hypothetical protein
MLAIRKQLSCYKDELHGLLNANKPANEDANEMWCKRYIFTPVLLLQFPSSAKILTLKAKTY